MTERQQRTILAAEPLVLDWIATAQASSRAARRALEAIGRIDPSLLDCWVPGFVNEAILAYAKRHRGETLTEREADAVQIMDGSKPPQLLRPGARTGLNDGPRLP